METSAKYVQIGVFLLAVVGATFGFVYWLYDSGGIGSRSVYRVRFENSVSGLLVGSAVLFNGIRVGEVTELALDAGKPTHVLATLSVKTGTPVRSDTRVDIDFQGFTGSPAISLIGGSSTAEPPAAKDGKPALLVALPEAGDDLTRSAKRVLKKINGMLDDNAEPVREGIADLGTFAKALSRNSDRVDGIMAGLERMTGGAANAAKIKTFDLTAPASFKSVVILPRAQLAVAEPTALNVLNSNRISVRNPDAGITSVSDAQWADSLPLLLQSAIIRSFENAGFQGALTQQSAGFEAKYQLIIDIRRFGFARSVKPSAGVALSVKILDRAGQLAGARLFQSSTPTTADAVSAVAPLDDSFRSVVSELIPWVLGIMLQGQEEPGVDGN